MTTKKSDARKFMEKLTGGVLTMAKLISSNRLCAEETQAVFAKKLGITVSHLSDIENGRKGLSPERAVKFARALGLSEKQFLRIALQDMLSQKGIKHFQVHIKAA